MIHVNRGTTSLGVFSEEEIRDGLSAGRFAPTDIGWREGMTTWQPLSQFPEFGGTAAPAVPPVQPVQPGAAPTSAMVAGRPGLPWEHRQERGFFNAFIETLSMVLTRPAEALRVMKREGGLGEPLIYALIGGSVGGIVSALFSLGFQSIGMFADKNNSLAAMTGIGIGFGTIILVPLFIVIFLFIWSALAHLCLMIVGGANQPFETTFQGRRVYSRLNWSFTDRATLWWSDFPRLGARLLLHRVGTRSWNRHRSRRPGSFPSANSLLRRRCIIAFMFMGAWTASHH